MNKKMIGKVAGGMAFFVATTLVIASLNGTFYLGIFMGCTNWSMFQCLAYVVFEAVLLTLAISNAMVKGFVGMIKMSGIIVVLGFGWSALWEYANYVLSVKDVFHGYVVYNMHNWFYRIDLVVCYLVAWLVVLGTIRYAKRFNIEK